MCCWIHSLSFASQRYAVKDVVWLVTVYVFSAGCAPKIVSSLRAIPGFRLLLIFWSPSPSQKEGRKKTLLNDLWPPNTSIPFHLSWALDLGMSVIFEGISIWQMKKINSFVSKSNGKEDNTKTLRSHEGTVAERVYTWMHHQQQQQACCLSTTVCRLNNTRLVGLSGFVLHFGWCFILSPNNRLHCVLMGVCRRYTCT